MDAEKITEILYTLYIASDMDCLDVRERIKNENLGNIISCHQGASKLCLVFKKEDFVIKWTREDSWKFSKEEAMKECEIYQKAKEQGLEMLFPSTEFFGEINAVLGTFENPVTITEMQKTDELSEYSNQKLSALLKKLVSAGEVVRTEEKKKAYFSLA